MNVQYDLVVDFKRPSKSNTIIVSENDDRSRVCHFILVKDKQPMDMTGVISADIIGTKPDGRTVFDTTNVEILKNETGDYINELLYTVPGDLTSVSGTVIMRIRILAESSTIESFDFYLVVRNSLYNENDEIDKETFDGFRELLDQCQKTLDEMKKYAGEATRPNPFPINITVEDNTYTYSGVSPVELSITNMAYVGEDIVIETDALEESSVEKCREYAHACEEAKVVALEGIKAAENAMAAADVTSDNAMISENNALISEGYAVGTQNGEAVVDPDSPYYHDNSKYWAKESSDSASAADAASELASNNAILSETKALVSEGYAVGTQNGEPVDSSSPYYHNNAKYWVDQAKGRSVEVENARVGYDGTEYSDLKTRIDTEVAELNESMTEITGYPKVINKLQSIAIDSKKTSSGTTISGDIFGNGVSIVNTPTNNVIAERLAKDSIHLKKGVRYTLYRDEYNVEPSSSTMRFDIRDSKNSNNIICYERTINGCSFEVDQDMDVILYIRIGANFSVDGLYFPKVVEERYKDSIFGIINHDGNMITPPSIIGNESISGIVKTNNLDGTFTLNGTTNAVTAMTIVPSQSGYYLENGEWYLLRSWNDADIKKSVNTYRIDIRIGSTIKAYEVAEGGIIFKADSQEKYTVMIRIASGMTFDNVTLKVGLYKVSDLKPESKRLRVCAYNVGNFSLGASGIASGTADIRNKLISTFSEINADVYMFSEWDEYWNKSDGIFSNDILGELKPHHSVSLDTTEGKYVAQMNYSDFPYSFEKMEYYADGEGRHFTDDVILIGNKMVHFICTHFPFSSKSLRHQDINKLFAYITENSITHYVIGGDFNLGLNTNVEETSQERMLEIAREDVELIKSLGGNPVQGGFWGRMDYDYFIDTGISDEINYRVKPYDCIVTSKNIKIRNVFVVKGAGSDHYPICADIEIS